MFTRFALTVTAAALLVAPLGVGVATAAQPSAGTVQIANEASNAGWNDDDKYRERQFLEVANSTAVPLVAHVTRKQGTDGTAPLATLESDVVLPPGGSLRTWGEANQAYKGVGDNDASVRVDLHLQAGDSGAMKGPLLGSATTFAWNRHFQMSVEVPSKRENVELEDFEVLKGKRVSDGARLTGNVERKETECFEDTCGETPIYVYTSTYRYDIRDVKPEPSVDLLVKNNLGPQVQLQGVPVDGVSQPFGAVGGQQSRHLLDAKAGTREYKVLAFTEADQLRAAGSKLKIEYPRGGAEAVVSFDGQQIRVGDSVSMPNGARLTLTRTGSVGVWTNTYELVLG